MRLAKEAEERDRRRKMGEEEWMKEVILLLLIEQLKVQILGNG